METQPPPTTIAIRLLNQVQVVSLRLSPVNRCPDKPRAEAEVHAAGDMLRGLGWRCRIAQLMQPFKGCKYLYNGSDLENPYSYSGEIKNNTEGKRYTFKGVRLYRCGPSSRRRYPTSRNLSVCLPSSQGNFSIRIPDTLSHDQISFCLALFPVYSTRGPEKRCQFVQEGCPLSLSDIRLPGCKQDLSDIYLLLNFHSTMTTSLLFRRFSYPTV